MKKTTIGLSGIALAAALSLTACGGADVDGLAQEFCDMTEEMAAATEEGDTDKLQEISKDIQAWAEENKDTEVDEDAFRDAVEDKCPDQSSLVP